MSLYYLSLVAIILNYNIHACNGFYQALSHQSPILIKNYAHKHLFANSEQCFEHIILNESHTNTKIQNGYKDRNELKEREILNETRRKFLLGSVSLLIATTSIPSKASAYKDNSISSKEGVLECRWTNNNQNNNNNIPNSLPITFITYASRIILHYDYPTINQDTFGSFAMSVQIGLYKFLDNLPNETSMNKKYELLGNIFLNKYGNDAIRHVGILLSLLPSIEQPIEFLQSLKNKLKPTNNSKMSTTTEEMTLFLNDPNMLLPEYYTFVYDKTNKGFIVTPSIDDILYNENMPSSSNNQEINLSPFGTCSLTPLKRDRPNYNPYIYSLLALSGGISCAITHTIVIPLDVVKTRLQTDDLSKIQSQDRTMMNYANYIIKNEGLDALVLGTKATIAGFFWYGISVYPSYLFLKRFLSGIISSSDLVNIDMVNTIISLTSGALASVLASVGLTPLEACRIRTVAQPQTYKPLGLYGTIQSIAREDEKLGFRLLYAGFPSLVTRQVIFGSIKFLTFERTCDYITSFILSSKTGVTIYNEYTLLPLVISLISGAVAGSLSSVISQPADSVLTYVSKQKNNLGVLEAAMVMIEKEGISSLFRGLGSRCLWAGCIIAGQFFLYDVFRGVFGVSGDNLSQVLEVVIGP